MLLKTAGGGTAWKSAKIVVKPVDILHTGGCCFFFRKQLSMKKQLSFLL
jgi:hypothetical protein